MRIVVMAFALGWAGLAHAGNTVVYVVRHAEKVVGDSAPKDPPLTETGETRAAELARMLADVQIDGVYSTDTTRTRSTGTPTAKGHSHEVKIYDHKAPEALAGALTEEGGSFLIVGHSNTVPGIVDAFGGKGGPELDELTYDRLYQVIVPESGDVVTNLMHFGPRNPVK